MQPQNLKYSGLAGVWGRREDKSGVQEAVVLQATRDLAEEGAPNTVTLSLSEQHTLRCRCLATGYSMTEQPGGFYASP